MRSPRQRKLFETLDLLTRQTGVALTHCSRDLRYLWGSQEYANWIQLPLNAIIGRPILDVLGKEAFESLRPNLERVLTGVTVHHQALTNYQSIGKRWISATHTPTLDVDDNATGWISVIVDITEHRRVEEAVRECEERFELLANSAPVLIWMIGPDKSCTYVNKSWLEFTGRRLDEELGQGWATGIHPEDRRRCIEGCSHAFENLVSHQMEYRLRRHDGEYRWILDSAVPRFNTDGSFAGYVGCGIDVTERKLAEDAIANAGRKLIAAHEEERTRIARELHDDIGQRLSLLAIGLDQFQQRFEKLSPEALSEVSELLRQTSSLTTDVHAMSHNLHSSKIQMLGLLEAMKSACHEFSQQHDMEIEFDSQDSYLPLPTDISLGLFRVLQEALQNARKHSGVRRVRVQLRKTDGEIHLVVSDSGRGFDLNSALQGQGLGLTSMRERVRLVDGAITIQSEPNCGTTISATVPFESKDTLDASR